ncbi:MAG: zf-HC2 domain-containing protein [Candidatus Omnitrophica bacterium]|nr:zf-HC2 domain-containing protein [Candidatus Omnitrophota bacterium]
MMDCKEIRKLLISDYADNEIGLKTKQIIQGHLSNCPACRELEQKVASLSNKLKEAKEILPAEEVWQKIRAEITQPQEAFNLLDWLKDKLSLFIPPKRLAYAYAASAIMILFVFLFITQTRGNREKTVENYIIEQVEFMDSLDAAGITNGLYIEPDIFS